MASQKISQFSAITTLASGDYFPVIQASGTTNKRVDVGVLDVRYAASASGELAHEALASGNAALVEASVALASGNAALVDASVALASGNAALTDVSGKYDKTGGPISGPVIVQSQSIGSISTTNASGVIFLDFGSSNNFDITLVEASNTLAAPVNASGGQTGQIVIRQDGVGSRLLTYSGGWQFVGGSAPSLSTAAGATDSLSYYCATSSGYFGILTANFQGV
jgi:hypothetical protein